MKKECVKVGEEYLYTGVDMDCVNESIDTLYRNSIVEIKEVDHDGVTVDGGWFISFEDLAPKPTGTIDEAFEKFSDCFNKEEPTYSIRNEGFIPNQVKGLLPKVQHDNIRIVEIANAIIRYTNANEKIPREWVDELAELI